MGTKGNKKYITIIAIILLFLIFIAICRIVLFHFLNTDPIKIAPITRPFGNVISSVCVESKGPPRAYVQEIVTGSNGSFTDTCDARGNLTKYYCERFINIYGDNPPPGSLIPSARVLSTTIDCNGQCKNGSCNTRCPDFNDRVSYVSIDHTSAVIKNETDGRMYTCALSYDETNDNYDCQKDPKPGDTWTIEAKSGGDTFSNCPVDVGGFSNKKCSYTCTAYNHQ